MDRLARRSGVALKAWRAAPAGPPRGGVVVLQEIFGANAHIRSVADRYAELGYLAIAPALFDRAEPDVEVEADDAGIAKGRPIAMKLEPEKTMLDVAAAVRAAGEAGKVGVVGYCWGGWLAWLAACRLPGISAASCYYGGRIAASAGETPKIPTILHFGETDAHIPLADVDKIRAAHPGLPIHLYPADHAFNRDGSSVYHGPSAALARARTLELFAAHVG